MEFPYVTSMATVPSPQIDWLEAVAPKPVPGEPTLLVNPGEAH